MRVIAFFLALVVVVGTTYGANYMYEKASVRGVGHKNVEQIISTQTGFDGNKLVEKESGSGNVITEKTELDAERQFNSGCTPMSSGLLGVETTTDYINFTKEAEFEYMSVSYQTGIFDQKWIEKLCVQNYKIGATLTEMYTHAEHLQKSTQVKATAITPIFSWWAPPGYFYWQWQKQFDRFGQGYYGGELMGINQPNPPEVSKSNCCTGILESNLNSNVIGIAHIGWISKDPEVNAKGRHNEWAGALRT